MKKKMKRYEKGGMADESVTGAGVGAGLASMGQKSMKDHILEAMSAKGKVPLPSEGVESKTENQALKKVKTTAADAGKRLMDMTPQGRMARDVISRARQYPRGSEGESSFEQERGMKKGGKVSSASKRADGIAVKGKTKGRMI